MKKTDSQLITQVKQGDYQAFRKLFDKYRNGMVSYCRYLLKDVDEAENIVQESFIKLWEVRERLNPDKDVEAYLLKIIRNKSFSYFKRVEKDYALYAALQDHTHTYEVIPIPLEEHPGITIEAVMQLLPPKRRKIIFLTVVQGKTHKEVAKEMNISVNTVKNQMVQAKKYLQHKISPVLMDAS